MHASVCQCEADVHRAYLHRVLCECGYTVCVCVCAGESVLV